MSALAYILALIFAIAFLDTQDSYYLVLGLIATIIGMSAEND